MTQYFPFFKAHKSKKKNPDAQFVVHIIHTHNVLSGLPTKSFKNLILFMLYKKVK